MQSVGVIEWWVSARVRRKAESRFHPDPKSMLAMQCHVCLMRMTVTQTRQRQARRDELAMAMMAVGPGQQARRLTRFGGGEPRRNRRRARYAASARGMTGEA